jgi:alkanesulfonate monooxygenase
MSANSATVKQALRNPQKRAASAPLQIFSTCPSSLTTPDDYANRIIRVGRWSQDAGCTGILVYTDNSVIDPWLASQILIENTHSLCPLVAVQPAYMHPYAVAKMVSTLAFLHDRRIFLNMVAGGFKNDLAALNDTTPHDSRYARLVEYTQIIQRLVEGESPVSFEGQFYRVSRLTLSPPVPPGLRPGFLMSGSSEAGAAAARETGAIPIQYPEPPDQSPAAQTLDGPSGVRIGIVTRAQSADAWQVAVERFPENRNGQLTRQLAAKVSDSAWHHDLSERGNHSGVTRQTYWLRPFENFHTNCPYLVGSYDDVAEQLARYMNFGHRTFILDIPGAEEEFQHIGPAFRLASERAGL